MQTQPETWGLQFGALFRVIRYVKEFRLALDRVYRLVPASSRSGRDFTNSGGAVVVVQHAAQALAPMDHPCASKMARFWPD